MQYSSWNIAFCKKHFVNFYVIYYCFTTQISCYLCYFILGIKEYSNWPTIPQVFINGEFVGGCDIMLQMHQSGELVEELKKVGIKSALLTADEIKKEESK